MKRIFLTGASGCIGHYLTEALIQETEYELFLLVRNPDKLKLDCQARSGINIIKGDLQNIEQYSNLLQTVQIAILAATAWGGAKETGEVNVNKTLALLKALDSRVCEQIIYFSTASILDRHNQLLPQAGQTEHDYIRSKYQCFSRLQELPIAEKIIALFPTFVFGGDNQKPQSHITAGLPEVIKWINLIRFIQADGSFHFIHARDIAQVVLYLIEHGSELRENQDGQGVQKLILGYEKITVDEAIAEVCNYLNKPIYLRVPLTNKLANFLIKVFRIQMDSWSYFSFNYRHWVYQNPVSPASFGLHNYCSTVTDILKTARIAEVRSQK